MCSIYTTESNVVVKYMNINKNDYGLNVVFVVIRCCCCFNCMNLCVIQIAGRVFIEMKLKRCYQELQDHAIITI